MPEHGSDEDMTISAQSIVEKMVRQNQERDRQKEKIVENAEEWTKAINSLCASPNGKLLIKYMLRHNKLFIVDNTRDHVKMIENNGARKVYLELIRPFLTAEVISDIENQK